MGAVPMKFKRRGGGKEIIVPRSVKVPTPVVADNPTVQKPLVVALARAHRWQALLDQGKYNSISDLADTAGLDRPRPLGAVRLPLRTA